jgi:hypothetical protein
MLIRFWIQDALAANIFTITIRKTGAIPAQGIHDAPEQGKDHKGDDSNVLNMRHSGFYLFCDNRI